MRVRTVFTWGSDHGEVRRDFEVLARLFPDLEGFRPMLISY